MGLTSFLPLSCRSFSTLPAKSVMEAFEAFAEIFLLSTAAAPPTLPLDKPVFRIRLDLHSFWAWIRILDPGV
jgi:hypothetical protein